MLSWMGARVVSADGMEVVADRAAGALLGTFVGDAVGMPFEGLSHRAIPEEVEMTMQARRGRGTYTDDTQMMIALAESLIARGCVDAEHLARTFLDAYESDRGYGRDAAGVRVVALGCTGGRGRRSGFRRTRVARQWSRDADRTCGRLFPR